MLKELIDLFKELASSHTRERDRFIAFLEQVSAELEALSAHWSEIATLADSKELPSTEIYDRLQKQRNRYEALLLFRRELDNKIDYSDLVVILDEADSEKSKLYWLANRALSDYYVRLENVRMSNPGLKSGLTRALRSVQSASLARKIGKRVERLNGLSGQFRAAVAVFKLQTPFF